MTGGCIVLLCAKPLEVKMYVQVLCAAGARGRAEGRHAALRALCAGAPVRHLRAGRRGAHAHPGCTHRAAAVRPRLLPCLSCCMSAKWSLGCPSALRGAPSSGMRSSGASSIVVVRRQVFACAQLSAQQGMHSHGAVKASYSWGEKATSAAVERSDSAVSAPCTW